MATAHVWFEPAVIDVNRAPPRTRTGVFRSTVPPSPSWPNVLRPQQYASPSAVTPQVWLLPAEIMVNTPEATATGDERSKFEPSPNCPPPFSPQQLARPLEVSAHEKLDPEVMLTKRIEPAPAMMGTALCAIDGSPS